MTWTYLQVKAADAALSPAIADPGAAAAALNAQTTTAQVAVSAGAVRDLLYARGRWEAIVAAADAARAGTAAAANISAQALYDAAMAGVVFDLSATGVGTQVQTDLGNLVAAGILTSADETAVLALTTATVPVWQPALTAGDVQTARAQ